MQRTARTQAGIPGSVCMGGDNNPHLKDRMATKPAKKATPAKAGQPTKYKPEFAAQALKLCMLGMTDAEMAAFFEVSESTLNLWKVAHVGFSESIKQGKAATDADVASRLFHRAMGYEHPEDDIRVVSGEIVITPTVKHYPPDTTAAIFWLKNRQRSKWRDKIDTEHTGPDEGPIQISVIERRLID